MTYAWQKMPCCFERRLQTNLGLWGRISLHRPHHASAANARLAGAWNFRTFPSQTSQYGFISLNFKAAALKNHGGWSCIRIHYRSSTSLRVDSATAATWAIKSALTPISANVAPRSSTTASKWESFRPRATRCRCPFRMS